MLKGGRRAITLKGYPPSSFPDHNSSFYQRKSSHQQKKGELKSFSAMVRKEIAMLHRLKSESDFIMEKKYSYGLMWFMET